MGSGDNVSTNRAGTPGAIAERLWRFFSSVRLAFVLMLIIIALSLIGALIIQVPGEVASDPQEYAYWLENVARLKYGPWTPLLSLFNLFGVFQSFWFLAAGALLMVNILICSLERWKNIRRLITGGPVRLPDNFYSVGTNRAELSPISIPRDDVLARTSGLLKSHSYRVRSETFQDNVYMAADKNRLYRLGTYLSHLSLILFILGYLVGSYLGFRNTNFVVPEGTVREVGYGTGLSLRLESFADEYYPDGSPSDFRSEVILYKDGREVDRATVRVNHPLGYEGTRFFQSFFGPTAVVQMRDSSGQVIYEDNVAFTGTIESRSGRRYSGSFTVPQLGLTVQLISSAINAPDPMIKKGNIVVQLYHPGSTRVIGMDALEPGVPRTVGGFEFTYVREGKFSGFQVSKDPGNALIWIASTLFLLGIGMVMYLPHRQVWALCQPKTDTSSQLNIRSTTARGFGAASELKKLVTAIESELGVKRKK